MKRLGTLIYTTPFDYKVYALTMRDKNSSRVSVVMYIENPQGEQSDIISIPRKDIYTKKNWLNFMFDMEGDFGRDEISSIAEALLDIVRDDKNRDLTQSKATMRELHRAISDFIRENAEELEDNADADIFIKDAYGFMRTNYFERFIKENKELGYAKRVDVLKRLKIIGALVNGEGRPYDVLVSVGGKKKRVYKIVLDNTIDKEAVEEITI